MKRFIFTSSVPSMLNFCNFKNSNYTSVFLKLWQKYDNENYTNEASKIKSEEVKIDCGIDIRNSGDVIKEFVPIDIIQKLESKDSYREALPEIEEIKKQVENSAELPEIKKEFVINHLSSFSNTTSGILYELDAIDIYEKQYNVNLDKSQKFFYKQLNDNWCLGGRLDGILNTGDPEKDYIVEVKNRSFKFFDTTRNYEMAQIQLYMFLTDFKKARLVQKLNDEIKVTEIHYNKVFVNKLLKALCVYITFFDNFLEKDINHKKEFINMSVLDKENYLIKHLIGKTNRILF